MVRHPLRRCGRYMRADPGRRAVTAGLTIRSPAPADRSRHFPPKETRPSLIAGIGPPVIRLAIVVGTAASADLRLVTAIFRLYRTPPGPHFSHSRHSHSFNP